MKASVRTLLPVVSAGIALEFAWLLILFQGQMLLPTESSDTIMLSKVALLFGTAITFVTVALISSKTNRCNACSTKGFIALYVCGLIPIALFALCGIFASVPPILILAAMLLAGISHAISLGMWAEVTILAFRYDVGIFMAAAQSIGVLLALFVLFIPQPLLSLAMLFLPLSSLLVFVYVCNSILFKVHQKADDPITEIVLLPKTSFEIFLYGALYGVVVYLLFLNRELASLHYLTLGASVACGVVIYAGILTYTKKYIPFGAVQKLALPVTGAICLIICFFQEGFFVLVVEHIALALLSFISISNYLSLVALAAKHEISAWAMVSSGRIFIPVGLGVGIGTGYLIVGLLNNPIILYYIMFVVALILAIASSFFSFVVNPVENQELDIDPLGADQYERQCQKIIEKYGLSKREAEMLPLLGRGRNAQYIADAFVVSASTVKTHIYHIYQKLGIKSQQELMDALENIEA